MASENDVNVENEDVCVLCCKKIDIFAIGTCDHPVCYECSTRMRVLCKQNECPICRRDMLKVVFTENKETFSTLMERINSKSIVLQDKSIGVIFASNPIQKAYFKLLEHRCPVCNDRYDKRFRTFNDLKEHVRKEHELFYCDLCVANLKIFTSERRCYTRQERATHRRKGDPDNKSHRGHPLCQFCDTRYMDLDELFRHLRRDHFYCHFCDMDANNQYYNSYEDLRAHFSQDHFLCEEGNCRLEQFTSVFRTQIDLKAHQASVHSRDLGKSATKQARTVEVAFTLKPRPGMKSREHDRSERHQRYNNDDEGAVGYDNSRFGSLEPSRVVIDPNNSSDFPQLGGGSNNESSRPASSTVTFTKHSNRPPTIEDFPQLGPNSSNSTQRTSNFTITTHDNGIPSTSQPGNSTVRLSISKRNRPDTNLSIRMSVPMSSTVQVRPKWNDFPALGSQKSTIETPRWVTTKSKPPEPSGASLKVKPNVSKPQKAPVGLSEFPELTHKEKKAPEVVKKRSTVTLECVNNHSREPKGGKSDGGDSSKKGINKKEVNKVDVKKKNDKVKKKKKGPNEETDNLNNNHSKNDVNNDIKVEQKVTKKLSELKINPLKNEVDNNHSNQEEKNENRSESTQIPPGFSVKPPPGFEGYKNLGLLSEMTFTNSTGQSFPILTTSSRYKPPKDFEKRNENLIKNLNQITNGDINSIIEFKQLSALFRNGEYPSSDYYNLCTETMKQHFDKLFPELLILLPDVLKQQELYKEHLKRTSDAKGLEVCLKCDQIVLKRDLSEHFMTHTLETNFPMLSQPESENYWRK